MQNQIVAPSVIAPRFELSLAEHGDDIKAAQALRWTVFCEEQGAVLDTPQSGLDIDSYDDHCEHLLVRDLEHDRVVGTYRLLTADAARKLGGYYSEGEFAFADQWIWNERCLELGRSCVHSDHRSGAVIALLWMGLSAFISRTGHDALIGCASIPLAGCGAGGRILAHSLAQQHRAPSTFLVEPRRPLEIASGGSGQPFTVPPLVKGYLRSGARVCGAPHWDPEFNCADLLLRLDVALIEARYARRFLNSASGERALQ